MSDLVLFIILIHLTSAARRHGYLWDIHHSIFKSCLCKGVRGDLVDKLTVLMMELNLFQLMYILIVLEAGLSAIVLHMSMGCLTLNTGLLHVDKLVLLRDREAYDGTLLLDL